MVTKHNLPIGILLDAGSVDRFGDFEVGVTIEDLLDTGLFTPSLKSSIEYLAMSVGIRWALKATECPRKPAYKNIESDTIVERLFWESEKLRCLTCTARFKTNC